MINEELKKVTYINLKEEIRFSDGRLILTVDGYLKKWHVFLNDVENFKSLVDIFDSSKQYTLEFLCESGNIYYGEVQITNISNNNFELSGAGPLNPK